MGQIVSTAAKPKRCNLNQLSQVPTPAAGEYILVSSDNSMNAAGQGNFDCYIVGNGTTAATALPLIKTYANDVDDEPTAGSNNLVKSGGVYPTVYKAALKQYDINDSTLNSNMLPALLAADDAIKFNVFGLYNTKDVVVGFSLSSSHCEVRLRCNSINLITFRPTVSAPYNENSFADEFVEYNVLINISNNNDITFPIKGKISINWKRLFVTNLNFADNKNVKLKNITVVDSSNYPFIGKKMFVEALSPIKDIYIPNRDNSKHYFIWGYYPVYTNYIQVVLGVSDTTTPLLKTDVTQLVAFEIKRSDITDAMRQSYQLIEKNGYKILLDIKSCEDMATRYYSPQPTNAQRYEFWHSLIYANGENMSIDWEAVDKYSPILLAESIAAKQNTLVSGESLKTINSQSLLGSGNIEVITDVSSKQDALVSGQNIKTINDQSILGSGNLVIGSGGTVVPSPVRKVTTIAELKTALSSGERWIDFDTSGQYVELNETIVIPSNTYLWARNAYVKRASGFIYKMFELQGENSFFIGMTIDGNRSSISEPYWSNNVEILTKDTSKNIVIEDVRIIHGNDGIMFEGENNIVRNCVFSDMGSAGVHYSAAVNCTVENSVFKNCCQEAAAYGHSEGAILLSNWCFYVKVNNNYIEDCPEGGFGAIDTADNSFVECCNNTMVRTKGVIGRGSCFNAPYSIRISGNRIIDSKKSTHTEPYGICFTAINGKSAGEGGVIISENMLINSGMKFYGIGDLSVLDNKMYSFNNYEYADGDGMISACGNVIVSNNTIISAEKNGVLRFLNCSGVKVTGNKVIGNNKTLQMSKCRNISIINNDVIGLHIHFIFENLETCTDAILKSNHIVAYNNPGFKTSSNAIVKDNVFVEPGAGSSYKWIEVGASMNNVCVKDNKSNLSGTFDGTDANGCVYKDNLTCDASLLTSFTKSLSHLSLKYQYASPLFGMPYFNYLVPNEGYALPDTIQVTQTTLDGTTETLSAGEINIQDNYGIPYTKVSDYIYDQNTGLFFMLCVKNPIAITAVGVSE